MDALKAYGVQRPFQKHFFLGGGICDIPPPLITLYGNCVIHSVRKVDTFDLAANSSFRTHILVAATGQAKDEQYIATNIVVMPS